MLDILDKQLSLYSSDSDFISTVEYTADHYGFSTELIEKDFLCTLVLTYLYTDDESLLTFKGGTLLSKVYANHYRLSEDLDFSISISSTASRKQRKILADPYRKKIEKFVNEIPFFTIAKPLSGVNESKQYNAVLSYNSKLNKLPRQILIDIGLRETHLMPSETKLARTLLINPFTHKNAVQDVPVSCLSLEETYSEKIRAALCRQKPAIRDFFDLYYATSKGLLNLNDKIVVEMVRKKLTIPDNNIIDLGYEKYQLLVSKIHTELFPTLRNNQRHDFELDQIIKDLVTFVVEKLKINVG